MRPFFRQTFVHLQIPLDDMADADIMSYFLQAIEFIQTELNGGKRVLVHCQAGISMSPSNFLS
jgi:dual specificity phosphatase 12